MQEERLRAILEGQGIESSKADEIIGEVMSGKKDNEDNSTTISPVSDALIVLQDKLSATPLEDWRHRASLQARIIALGIDR